MKVSQIIFTGVPKASCKNLTENFVSFGKLEHLKSFKRTANCILFKVNSITVRVTKSGFLKIHLNKENLLFLSAKVNRYKKLFKAFISIYVYAFIKV